MKFDDEQITLNIRGNSTEAQSARVAMSLIVGTGNSKDGQIKELAKLLDKVEEEAYKDNSSRLTEDTSL